MTLIKKQEAAEILGISTRSFDRYCAAGCFKVVPYGSRSVRVRLADIERALKEGFQPKKTK